MSTSNPHDEKVPQKAQRHGGQKGARVYVPAAALKAAFTRKSNGTVYEVPEDLYYVVKAWTKKTVVIRFGAKDEL